MPKNPLKNFRRKSSGNVLDLHPEPTSTTPPATAPAPATSTFRVLERPDKAAVAAGSSGYAGGVKRTSGARPASSFLSRNKGKSVEDLLASTNRSVGNNHPQSSSRPNTVDGVLNGGRGSGGTAISASSGYFDTSSSSARYSSSSTLPSSVEAEHDQESEDLFPRKAANTPSNRSSAASALPEPPSFSTRAGRTMSFGLRNKHNASPGAMAPPPTAHMPDVPENSLIRDRATTMSSNASTAVPPRLESNLGASDFGSDFGNMFEGLASSPRKNSVLAPPPAHGNYGRSVRRQESPTRQFQSAMAHQQRFHQESEPALPPVDRDAFTPSPEALPLQQPEAETRHRPANLSAISANRYSWASRTSNDGLMSPNLGSDIASPTLQLPSTFSRFRPGAAYQAVPDRYASPSNDPDEETERPASSSGESEPLRMDHRAKSPLSESFSAVNSPQKLQKSTISTVGRDDLSSTGSAAESMTTPRANRPYPVKSNTTDESLFDVSLAGPTSRTLHPVAPLGAPRLLSTKHSPGKRMTRLEFEMQRNEVGDEESEASDQSDDADYDDDDEVERQAELARQRRKQEANMSVYRQQMMKVSGGNPAELHSQNGRPSMDRASFSASAIAQSMSNVGLGAELEEDDDVPLGILQAHGFPNRNRPPTRLGSAPPTPSGRAMSMVGPDANGNLPAFARNLPADPYFGASIVNPMHRESLAFGSGGSVYGGVPPSIAPQPPMPGMPNAHGGLVGVIAGEERARAARRTNPQQGPGFNVNGVPLPTNMNQQQMPPMPRSNSMMSMMAPNMGMPGGMMPQMMGGTDMANQQQMMQLLQMQQQMMQQMMAMQQGQMPGQMSQMNSPQMQNNGFSPMQNGMQRPASSHSMMPGAPQSMNQQRSSTMTNLKPPGYAGSIYDYSLGPPNPGYTPSIAPSERSNIGMPSRYRPVTTDGSQSRTGSMTSQSAAATFAKKNASTGSLLNPSNLTDGNTNTNSVPRSTIKVIDKPKGSLKSPVRSNAEEEDDEEGWKFMRKRREERKNKGKQQQTNVNQQQEQSLQELYQSFE